MKVIWQRLRLTGFGRFAGTITLHMQPGFNVLVAPNEHGKSTLMAGLAAVVFGLPAIADESQFGQGKFRNWHAPERFEGELQFVRGDVTYRVRRNFSTHAVSVSEQTASGWKDIVTGEHNPRARRRNARYDDFLHDVIGVDRVELFWSAFAFGSPLPQAGELDEHVQRLVSGAGSGHYNAALERLREATFRLTRASRDIGVAERDRGKDGELERLRQEEEDLSATLEQSRSAVDEHQEVQEQLHEWRSKRDAAGAERAKTQATLHAWTAWRDARRERQRFLAEQSKALRAWNGYNDLSRQLDGETARLAREFPEFEGAQSDVGDKLARLRELEGEEETRRVERRAAVAAVIGRADEKLSAWQAFVEERAAWQALKRRLAEEFSVFHEADAATRQAYADFGPERERLARAVDDARHRLAEAEEEAERRRAAAAQRDEERARFEKEYADLALLHDDDAAAAIDERRLALQRRDALLAEQASLYASRRAAAERSEGEQRFSLPPRFAAAGFALAVVVAAGVYWLVDPVWAVVALFIVGAAAFALGNRLGVSERTESRQAADEEAERLADRLAEAEAALAPDARLGRYADADAHELGVLSQRLEARRQAAAALAHAEGARDGFPASDGATGNGVADDGGAGGGPEFAAAALVRAEDAEKALRKRVEPGLARFGEDGLARAYGQWTELQAEATRRGQQVHAWVTRRFGVVDGEAEDVLLYPPGAGATAGVWSELAGFAAKAGGLDEVTLQDLLQVLPTWTGAFADEAAAAVEEAEAKNDGDAPSATDGFGGNGEEMTALRTELDAVLAASDGDSAQALNRWQRFQQEGRRIESLQAQRLGLLSGQGVEEPEELHVQALDQGNRAEAARRQLEQLSDDHPALPDADAADDGDAVAVRLAALREQEAAARAAQESADDRYRRLLERQASLSGVRVLNIAAAETELQQLRERREQIQFDIEATALAYRELVQAAETYEQTHRVRLSEGASAYVQQFTGRPREIVLDEQFRVSIQDPDGPLHGVARLSQGARDQLYLALRLAVADLVAAEAPLPLLLDDPFVHCDEERLGRIRHALDALQDGRQVLLFSHRDDFADWGHRVIPEGEGWGTS